MPVEEIQQTALALSAKDRAELARHTALSLSASDRAALAHELLVSLEEDEPELGSEPELDQELAAEVLRRSEEYHQGQVRALDWEESLARVRATFRQMRQS